MSIRVSGFRLPGLGFAAADALVRAFRAEIDGLHRTAIARHLVGAAARSHDLHRAGLAPAPDRSPLSKAYEDLLERQRAIAQSGRRDPEIDFGLSLCLVADPQTEILHGLIYTEQADWEARWRARPEVEDFSFWNHTDRPDDVAPDAWAARGETWRRILGPAGVPARVGWTAEIADPLLARLMDPVAADDVAAHAPSFAQRAHQAAVAHALRAWDQANPPDPAAGEHGVFHRALQGLRACVPGGAADDLYRAGLAHAEATLDHVLDPRALGVRI